MGASGRGAAEQQPTGAKPSPRIGEQHYPASSTKTSPRAGTGIGIGVGVPSMLPTALLESKWALSAAITVFLFLAAALTFTSSPAISASSFLSFLPASHPQQHDQQQQPASSSPPPAAADPGAGVPRLAYLVSGSKGDLDRLWRTLHALYHPRNLYVVHLDRESPVGERLELAARVANSTVFRRVGNVEVIRRANMVTYRGPTMVANTLHACAVLLRRSRDWDWFINLSASDYPLVSQDGKRRCDLLSPQFRHWIGSYE